MKRDITTKDTFIQQTKNYLDTCYMFTSKVTAKCRLCLPRVSLDFFEIVHNILVYAKTMMTKGMP